MKRTKQILAMLLCAVLLVTGTVAVTVAYLTASTNAVTNTFTVGSVAITLDEAKVTEYGVVDGTSRVSTNTYKLIPGHEYVKDPTVHVTEGSEQCWLFVKVENGLAGIEATANTTTGVKAKIADQMKSNGWVELGSSYPNVYYFNSTIDAKDSQVDKVVFNNFTLAGDATVADYANAKITIDAYAVQADGFDSAAAAWEAAPTGWIDN